MLDAVMGRTPCVIILGLICMATPGCYDGFDPLDPEVLAEIARERGDADGIGKTGVYRGTFDPIDCGCTQLVIGFDVSLCALISTATGFTDNLDVEVIQADGTVRITTLPLSFNGNTAEPLLLPTLYGPLDSDGTIAAGGVVQADSIVVGGQVYGRMDGTLVGETLEVDYRQRVVVDVLGGADERAPIDSIDCRERIGMSLTWAGTAIDPSEG